ncbi:glycosyltransferase family 2 protein [Bacteroides nordii]|jgi:glycosyltransferase, family 2|uniref:glycosyltransferase family 2 protein n=1 Tax=Bacteroides nordii TaxID=291645 RepID=UPI002A809541|nr:glycosyltransferase family 2 protein [Bacteroides nordii]
MFISIVTVVFNGEKTIERTLQSILNQQFDDYEYIIQDGCSSDNTVGIAKSYEKKFNGRLRIYSEKDKGIYDAMNRGIQKAKGDYVWLVNSDDYITGSALQDLYNFCKSIEFKKCIISARMNIVDANSGSVISSPPGSSFEIYEKACKKLKMGICHPATVVPKVIYDTLGLYDDRYYISADVDFCLRTFENNVSVVFPDIILTNMTNGGISNQFPFKKNMHDCLLRAAKFCKSPISKLEFISYYFVRLVALKTISKIH